MKKDFDETRKSVLACIESKWAVQTLMSSAALVIAVAATVGWSAEKRVSAFSEEIDKLKSRVAETEKGAEDAKTKHTDWAKSQSPLLFDQFVKKQIDQALFDPARPLAIAGTLSQIKREASTGLKTSDYIILTTGFRVHNADINEDKKEELIKVIAQEKNGEWWITTYVNTDSEGALWDVQYIAIRRDVVRGTYAPAK